MDVSKCDDTLEALIKLRKAREDGGQIGFPVTSRDFLDDVNFLLWNCNMRFGNIKRHKWECFTMDALLPGEGIKRKMVVLEARFGNDTPEYRLTCINEKGKPYSEFTFFRIADPEIGLLACLNALCPYNLGFTKEEE